MKDLLLLDFIDLERLHREIARGKWKFEDESDGRVVASLRIEFVENLFLCLFVWMYDGSVDLECTEGLEVNSLFYVKFKNKTSLSAIKHVAADLVVDLINERTIDVKAAAKEHKVATLR